MTFWDAFLAILTVGGAFVAALAIIGAATVVVIFAIMGLVNWLCDLL